jgi:hypothetical protein
MDGRYPALVGIEVDEGSDPTKGDCEDTHRLRFRVEPVASAK